jgi:hypothetical protein
MKRVEYSRSQALHSITTGREKEQNQQVQTKQKALLPLQTQVLISLVNTSLVADRLPEQASMQALAMTQQGIEPRVLMPMTCFAGLKQVMTHTIDLNANHVSLQDRKVQQGKHQGSLGKVRLSQM